MEELLLRIAEAVESLNITPSWYIAIQIISLVVPVITILVLVAERLAKKRPYLQIAIEPIRSVLACAVIRNVGTCPLEIVSIDFNDEFTTQLTPEVKDRLNKVHSTELSVAPGQFYVLSFNVILGTIIQDFNEKKLTIKYKYKKAGRSKRLYSEESKIDFSSLGPMLVYKSESDELVKSVGELEKQIGKILNYIETTKNCDIYREIIPK